MGLDRVDAEEQLGGDLLAGGRRDVDAGLLERPAQSHEHPPLGLGQARPVRHVAGDRGLGEVGNQRLVKGRDGLADADDVAVL